MPKGGIGIVVLLVVLTIAALTDIFYEKVPNAVIVGGIVLGIAYRLLIGEFAPVEMLCGFICPILLFWPLFLLRAMGAGDIKLMSVMGLFLGWRAMLCAVGAAIVFAACMSLYKGLKEGILKKRFGYFVQYFRNLFLYCRMGRGELPVYRTGNEVPGVKIHFAVALLAGGIIVSGGGL